MQCETKQTRSFLFRFSLVQNPFCTTKIMNRHVSIFISFLILCFFQGIFLSGFIPILKQELADQASFAYSLYFLGLVLGQLAIYRIAKLSHTKRMFCLYQLLFSATLIFMGLSQGAWSLIIGRFLEGLAAGLALPLLFANIVESKALGNVHTRIALFNSFYILGFVLGPILLEYLLQNYRYQSCLLSFSMFFIAIVLGLFFMFGDEKFQKENKRPTKIEHNWHIKKNVALFFFTKSIYGYVLSFVPAHASNYLSEDTTVGMMMLQLSGILIISQVIHERVLRVVSKKFIELFYPMAVSLCCMSFWGMELISSMYVMVFFHSALVLVSYGNFAGKQKSVRSFALYNCLSDPGMFLGASLAIWGIQGSIGIIILSFVPLICLGMIRKSNQGEPS